jgi:hypothetical protein
LKENFVFPSLLGVFVQFEGLAVGSGAAKCRMTQSENRVDTAAHTVEECRQKILAAVKLANLGKNLF